MAQPVIRSSTPKEKAGRKTKVQPVLYLNLRPFAWAGVALLVVLPPYLRGLFFAPEQLLVQVLVALTFAFWAGDRLLDRISRHPGKGRGDAAAPGSLAGPATSGISGSRNASIPVASFLDLLICLYVAAYLLSLIRAVNMRAAVGELLEVLSLALLYFIISRLVRSPRNLGQLLGLVFWAGVGVAVIGLGAALGVIYYPGAFDGHIIMSTLQYKNSLAAYLTTVSVAGLFLQARQERLPARVLYGAGNILLLVAILSTQSRGGWILYPLVYLFFFLGLPRTWFYSALYTFFINLGIGMLVSRGFLPAVIAGRHLAAAETLALGLAAMVVAEIAVQAVAELSRRYLQPRMRTFLAAAAAVYAVFIAVVYFTFAVQAFPSVAGQFLPTQVLARAQAVSAYEPSFQARMTYYADALKIIAGHPLTGAGGGAWNALYHTYQESQYFTTEVHSHFFQVGAEAGLTGLAIFALIWPVLGLTLLRLRRTVSGEDWLGYSWTAGMAAFGLAGHSFFDFNLSLPALGMELWSLMAVVRGAELAWAAEEGEAGLSPSRAPTPAGGGSRAAFWLFWPARLYAGADRPLVFALVAALLFVALFLPSYNLYRAGRLGAAGARAMAAKELPRAQVYYREAVRLDPFTATYAVDLAQVNTGLGLAQADQKLLEEARDLAARAAALEPYNPQVRAAASLVYLLQGYLDRAVAEAEAVVAANPWDVGAYEQLGAMYLAAAQAYTRSGREELAGQYVRRALALPFRVQQQARKAEGKPWQGPQLAVTPRLELIQGQASYLTGDYGLAVDRLLGALHDKALEQEAIPWLAAGLTRLGRPGEAEKYLARYPGLRSQYEDLMEEK
ncbi:MAG: hypothetical protein D9V47_12835 [Clostridia bacterium]|nr:MAG: hypothetical protein D9V47_12835 [Clostridia bacterium]